MLERTVIVRSWIFARLRDMLPPTLLSGEIRVDDAETLAEEVV